MHCPSIIISNTQTYSIKWRLSRNPNWTHTSLSHLKRRIPWQGIGIDLWLVSIKCCDLWTWLLGNSWCWKNSTCRFTILLLLTIPPRYPPSAWHFCHHPLSPFCTGEAAQCSDLMWGSSDVMSPWLDHHLQIYGHTWPYSGCFFESVSEWNLHLSGLWQKQIVLRNVGVPHLIS